MTFQVRETLLYQDQHRPIHALPLEGCPKQVPAFQTMTTACWRGYLGAWEVRDDVLHLVRLIPFHGQEGHDGLGEMFPGHGGAVEATWYSGEIPADDGRRDDAPFFVLVFHRGKLLLEQVADRPGRIVTSRLTRHAAGLVEPGAWGFLVAIHANLGDPVARLVYADWLEERGDPRGQILRDEARRWGSTLPDFIRPPGSQDVLSGYVDPEETIWFWRRLCGIPERTPSQARLHQLQAQWAKEG